MSRIQRYLSEIVYAGMDGSVTTFAVVAGAEGAGLGSSVVIILGCANLIADGFSMSVGSYLSSKSKQQQYEKSRKKEYWEIDNLRDSEVDEIRDIFMAKGFEGDLLEQAVAKITENRDHWVDMMMKHELQLIPDAKTSLSVAVATFISFLVVGSIPLAVYFLDFAVPLHIDLFLWSSILTFSAFVAIGWMKSLLTDTSHLKGVGETLALGLVASGLAYVAGSVLDRIFG